MNTKTVDVIIPTYKPDEKFIKLIEKLNEQSYPINRIIVINTEEKLFHLDKIKNYNNVYLQHITFNEFDHGGTRDMAARMSHSDIIIFMTQDAMPENDYLIESLVECFVSDDIGAAYARQLPDENCNEIEKFTRSFNYPDEGSVKSQSDINRLGIKTYFCSNVCAAYQRDLYLSLGGFMKHTIFNEDMIFASKIIQSGSKIVYCANARVIHSHNYSNMQQLKRNFDLGVSQKDNEDIFIGIKSENEGIKLVLQTAKHCFKIGTPWLVVDLFFKSGFKFMGYKLGLSYQRLPKWLIRNLTMNKGYWIS
jgi:GT2 family glycosyltransferase